MMGLTETQHRALTFIRSYMDENGQSPSYREIGDYMGVKGPSAVHHLLNRLAERGHVRKVKRRPRAIEIVEPVGLGSVSTEDLLAELKRRGRA